MEDKLTRKELMFSIAYASNGNASESARLAGYAEANAAKQGFALLQRTRVKREIDKRSAQFLLASGLTKSGILSDLIDLYNQAVRTEALGVARDCLRLLGLEVGLFQTEKKVEHQHNVTFEQLLKNSSITDITPEKPAITIN